MNDFTVTSYKAYLEAILQSYPVTLRFDEYFELKEKPQSFCIVRHDVDRKPLNALGMARLEHSLGVRASYYFRAKRHTFDADVLKEVSGLGHEIGYHYESLSDARGDQNTAIKDFETHLAQLRAIVPIKTIVAHGRPLEPFDNSVLWAPEERKRLFAEKYGLLGDVKLDVDYTDIAYICDTGRNWTEDRNNTRDRVNSGVSLNFESGHDLLDCLKQRCAAKLVFSVHPERWEERKIAWIMQWMLDSGVNLTKAVVNVFSRP